MKPTVLESVPIQNNDSMIMFNFRSDRMIQLLRSLKDPNFNEFNTRKLELTLVTMTDYEQNELYKDLYVAFEQEELKNTLGQYISKLGMNQLRLSEFEKSGHVTFYFSGCSNEIFDKEDRKALIIFTMAIVVLIIFIISLFYIL
jgi:2,3-bisphosphoglycerate-independent phosphoglycerate mutase